MNGLLCSVFSDSVLLLFSTDRSFFRPALSGRVGPRSSPPFLYGKKFFPPPGKNLLLVPSLLGPVFLTELCAA